MDYESQLQPDHTWPEPVKVSDRETNMVRLSGLPKATKQRAWAEIKSTNPSLAELLKCEGLHAIVQEFDAEIFIDSEFAPSLPREHLKARNKA